MLLTWCITSTSSWKVVKFWPPCIYISSFFQFNIMSNLYLPILFFPSPGTSPVVPSPNMVPAKPKPAMSPTGITRVTPVGINKITPKVENDVGMMGGLTSCSVPISSPQPTQLDFKGRYLLLEKRYYKRGSQGWESYFLKEHEKLDVKSCVIL